MALLRDGGHRASVPATATRRVLSGHLQSKHVQSPRHWLGSRPNHPLYRLLKPTVQSVSPSSPPHQPLGLVVHGEHRAPPVNVASTPTAPSGQQVLGSNNWLWKQEPWGLTDELQSASVSHTFRVGGVALRLMVLPFSQGGARL